MDHWQTRPTYQAQPLPTMSPAPPTLRHCGICLEQLAAEEFPHKCLKCSHGGYCANCLKEWFIDACKNESKMPPKCCSAIPLSAVSNLLTTAQVNHREHLDVYKLTKPRSSFTRLNTKNGVLLIASTVLYQHAQLSSRHVCTLSQARLLREVDLKMSLNTCPENNHLILIHLQHTFFLIEAMNQISKNQKYRPATLSDLG